MAEKQSPAHGKVAAMSSLCVMVVGQIDKDGGGKKMANCTAGKE